MESALKGGVDVLNMPSVAAHGAEEHSLCDETLRISVEDKNLSPANLKKAFGLCSHRTSRAHQ